MPFTRFNLHLDTRIEYLTLAVGNAKSHPVSVGGRNESAIAFLTDLEEKVEVAQVQLELYNLLLPHVNDAPEVGERIQQLSKRLFTMTEVSSVSSSPNSWLTPPLLYSFSKTMQSLLICPQ